MDVVGAAVNSTNFLEVLSIPVATDVWLHNLALRSETVEVSAMNWDPSEAAPTLWATAVSTHGWKRGINSLHRVYAAGARRVDTRALASSRPRRLRRH